MSPLMPVLPMDAIRPGPSAQNLVPPAQAMPTQVDAFSASLAGGNDPSLNPSAIGRKMLSGLDGFNAQESQFRSTVSQASGTDAAGAGDAALPDADAALPAQGVTAPDMMARGNALQQRSMGVMMQTYSFALEATLVTNAATTFTSSINTLIKTQ